MTLVDTSAWIEFLHATRSETHRTIRELLEADAELASTEVIVMEVLPVGATLPTSRNFVVSTGAGSSRSTA